jgi:hypothetical protein
VAVRVVVRKEVVCEQEGQDPEGEQGVEPEEKGEKEVEVGRLEVQEEEWEGAQKGSVMAEEEVLVVSQNGVVVGV